MGDVDNRRIGKNAIALTLRMIIVTVVGLYTSRLVLEALGVEDYGLYALVGGIVGFASFLNASMSGSTLRFITYGMGKNDAEELKRTFSTSLQIHIFIALIVLLLAETVGLWFVNTQLVIPENRLFAANVLYQLSVLTMLVTFTQSPYSAEIMAHERLRIYAWFELVSAFFKLIIVFVVISADDNRLILYGVLLFVLSTAIALCYRLYCVRNFPEARLSFGFNRRKAKEMLAFSAMNLYGNLCEVAKAQGQPVVLNMFYGLVANAASGIALTVSGTLQGFTSAISQSFVPQIIKQYAAGDFRQMESVMRNSIIFSITAFGILSVPLLVCTEHLLYLWLGTVPLYTVDFVRLLIIGAMMIVVINCVKVAINATGNIRAVSFGNGTVFLLCPVAGYFLLRSGFPAYMIYLVDVIAYILIAMYVCMILHRQIAEFRIGAFVRCVATGIGIVGITVVAVMESVKMLFPAVSGVGPALCLIICTTFAGAVIIAMLMWILVLNRNERDKIKGFVNRFISRICRRKD
ncbi:MAG: polysaccharide biosynthesis protein [Muribaculaceae bacterium]